MFKNIIPKNILLCIFAVFFVSSTASASIVFNPSVFYYMRDDDGSNSTAEFTQQIINLKLGYLDGSGLFLGVAYDMESRKYNSSSVSDEDRASLGGTIGYMSGGWSFLGTYYFSSELEDLDGSGWAADIGYSFNVSSFGIGPLLSYRHWEYDENGANTEQNNILPSIQFVMTF